MQPVEEWIRENSILEPRESSHLRYDSMEHQAPQDLAGIYRAYDPKRIYDWVDLSLTFAYLSALSTTGQVLDIGTGDGWPALAIAPYVDSVVGIDLSEQRVKTARANLAHLGHTNVKMAVASGENLPFADNSFDGVAVGTAIEQMNDPLRCLSEVNRVLTEKGNLVATVEHLPAELTKKLAEEVEFFRSEGGFIYRYTVKEAAPPREAEYRLFFKPKGKMHSYLSNKAASFPARPGFVRRPGEPGAMLLTGRIEADYGLPFLREAADAIDTAQYFELDHFDIPSLRHSLESAGFSDVLIRGRINRIAHPFFIDLQEKDELADLEPHFASICSSLGSLWRIVPPDDEPVLFARARRMP